MGSDEWESERREVAHSEARAVIEAQNATLVDIDDKALRTVRLNTVLVGVLIAGVEYAPDAFNSVALYGAFGGLVLSTLTGIATYDESNLYLGPEGDYIENLAAGEVNEPWGRDLATLYSGMISENYDDIKENGRYLRLALVFLAISVISAVVSVLI
ncbi:hypothetical protein [Haloparvum sedimenti]|uniref:hypothetical protein n=1 Tax=Haloparvum sedimenti TaxID=1678448 RepID=UPI00071E86AE|nr:hypothetical protein [Haloparvum sedimenti]